MSNRPFGFTNLIQPVLDAATAPAEQSVRDDYATSRDRYAAALNRAATITHANPAVRARALAAVDREAAHFRMAFVGHQIVFGGPLH